MSSPIKDFFKNSNVFITGGTGFLGLALIEKLLRSCPDVGTIYLLIRPKKGKDIQTRLKELMNNLIFEKLKSTTGTDVFPKLVAVSGDIGENNLGLSAVDRETLIDNVDIVYHSAATLDFQAGLKTNVNINLLGTRRILQLSSEMKNLKIFIYVSSAYANADRRNSDELLYSPPIDVEKIISITTTFADDATEKMTPKLLGDHPNSYTMTKALAEHEVAKSISKFPSVIVRPSMIVGAWKEPVPGWTFSKNGPQGFIMGASKGVIRRLPVAKDLIYDYIPVDIVVNELIVAAWHGATTNPKQTLVFHCTSSTCKPFAWSQVDSHINELLWTYPLKSAVWYPTVQLKSSLLSFRISAAFVHFLPAYLLDFMARLTGNKPILVRLHTNVNNSLSRLAPFIFQEWFFGNNKTRELQKLLSPNDGITFNLDISSLEWDSLFIDLALGVRRYLNNEELDTLPTALRKNQILYIMNVLVQVAFCCILWLLFSIITSSSMSLTLWVLPIIYVIFSFI